MCMCSYHLGKYTRRSAFLAFEHACRWRVTKRRHDFQRMLAHGDLDDASLGVFEVWAVHHHKPYLRHPQPGSSSDCSQSTVYGHKNASLRIAKHVLQRRESDVSKAGFGIRAVSSRAHGSLADGIFANAVAPAAVVVAVGVVVVGVVE